MLVAMIFREGAVAFLQFAKLIGRKLGELSHMLVKRHDGVVSAQAHHFVVVIDHGACYQGNHNKRRQSDQYGNGAACCGVRNDIAEPDGGNGLKRIPYRIPKGGKRFWFQQAKQRAARDKEHPIAGEQPVAADLLKGVFQHGKRLPR